MSASLVGSEMCIRDRYIDKNWDRSEARRAVRGGTMGYRSNRIDGRNRACLLYTSDAADDM
eukprot:9272142-Alexandrium_andersonii.AAC.1